MKRGKQIASNKSRDSPFIDFDIILCGKHLSKDGAYVIIYGTRVSFAHGRRDVPNNFCHILQIQTLGVSVNKQ